MSPGLQATDSLGESSRKRFSSPASAAGPQGPDVPSKARTLTLGAEARTDRGAAARAPVAALPGLGPKILRKVPDSARQVLIASGKGRNSPRGTVTLYTRTSNGRWRPGASWASHNGLEGWARKHHAGDLRSPVGVFTLSDAGGLKKDPGTRLPYHQSSGFAIEGTGFNGEDLEGTFNHVVAIDYNRVPGRSPLDSEKPLGSDRGGGIWLHIDHGGPTHGCVTLAKRDLLSLMRALDPDDDPVIVMGDHRSLSR